MSRHVQFVLENHAVECAIGPFDEVAVRNPKMAEGVQEFRSRLRRVSIEPVVCWEFGPYPVHNAITTHDRFSRGNAFHRNPGNEEEGFQRVHGKGLYRVVAKD